MMKRRLSKNREEVESDFFFDIKRPLRPSSAGGNLRAAGAAQQGNWELYGWRSAQSFIIQNPQFSGTPWGTLDSCDGH
jgi:hypothetical protein